MAFLRITQEVVFNTTDTNTHADACTHSKEERRRKWQLDVIYFKNLSTHGGHRRLVGLEASLSLTVSSRLAWVRLCFTNKTDSGNTTVWLGSGRNQRLGETFRLV